MNRGIQTRIPSLRSRVRGDLLKKSAQRLEELYFPELSLEQQQRLLGNPELLDRVLKLLGPELTQYFLSVVERRMRDGSH